MKMIKRLSLVLVLVMIFSSCFGGFALAVDVESFTDVPSDAWYLKELEYSVEKGLVNGTSSTQFSPSNTITRSEVITIIWRAFSGKTFSGTKFSDVPSGTWYTSAVYWGVKNGVVNGTSDISFSPSDPITRQDLATMLGRYIEAKNIDLPDADNVVSGFADANLISSYAAKHIEYMRVKGIFRGDEYGKANPRADMTRAEAMALIARVVSSINGDDLENWPDSETSNGSSSGPTLGVVPGEEDSDLEPE